MASDTGKLTCNYTRFVNSQCTLQDPPGNTDFTAPLFLCTCYCRNWRSSLNNDLILQVLSGLLYSLLYGSDDAITDVYFKKGHHRVHGYVQFSTCAESPNLFDLTFLECIMWALKCILSKDVVVNFHLNVCLFGFIYLKLECTYLGQLKQNNRKCANQALLKISILFLVSFL